MCIELCVTQTFITQPYFEKQFPVHKPKVPSSRFFFYIYSKINSLQLSDKYSYNRDSLVIKGVVCKDAAWGCLFNQTRDFSNMEHARKDLIFLRNISFQTGMVVWKFLIWFLIIVHLIVKKIIKIRHILVFRLKKIVKMTSLSERTPTKELWTICRYFQLVFQNFGTLFIYLRYFLTLNNLTN